MNRRRLERGFALPTVVITAVILMMLLVGGLSSITSVRRGINTQNYTLLAREAAEAGIAFAKSCAEQNISSGATTGWGYDATTLESGDNCSGAFPAGVNCTTAPTTTPDQCYVYYDATGSPQVRSTFAVNAVQITTGGTYTIQATGTVSLYNSAGAIYMTYQATDFIRSGMKPSFQSVAFGYTSTTGAFFGAIYPDGHVGAVGYNGEGQLGHGNLLSSALPQTFALPAGVRATSLYTSFLSVGRAMVAIGSDGNAYGAGANDNGQLGNNTVAATQSTPVKLALPAGVHPVYVTMLKYVIFVVGDDHNVYASGQCDNGQLGTGYTISGCADKHVFTRVALPTVTASPSTWPKVGNQSDPEDMAFVGIHGPYFSTDRYTSVIIMQDGSVYAWGANDYRQIGDGTATDRSTPVRVAANIFGTGGVTQAVQVANDGEDVYILGADGNVWTAGRNYHAALAGAPAPVQSSTNLCMDNPNNSTTPGGRVRIWNCNASRGQNVEWVPDAAGLASSRGTIRFNPNASTTLCLENQNASASNGNPIILATCDGSSKQGWWYVDDGVNPRYVMNPDTGKCLDNPSNSSTSGTELQLWACKGSASQEWEIMPSNGYTKVPISGVVRIATDQFTILFQKSDGSVWGAGGNHMGQLGNGTTAAGVAFMTKFDLTAATASGAVVEDIATTMVGLQTGDYANSYVVMSDGSVWGAGGNTYGQLGINSTSPAYQATPQKMLLPTGVAAKSVQSGLGTTVVFTRDRNVYTVGNNSDGQLGNGTLINSSVPIHGQYTNVLPTLVY